jgi:poly(A) polymerase
MENMTPQIFPRADHIVSRKNIDPDALKVLYRLKNHGFLAYLVGGGVRDLLLERPVKDFDVATDAHPPQLRRLFRNCRIVGRRFRLAHIIFRGKILEVSTFRRMTNFEVEESEDAESAGGEEAKTADLLIREDNTFGTPQEDAHRRDFTINGLFYDIASFRIIDFVGGMEDLRKRVIRTIGDPHIRFQEDPVRMLRAIRFAARLGFTIDPQTEEALVLHRDRIRLGARSRLLEETARMLEQGASEPSFRLMQNLGILQILLPSISTFLEECENSIPFWQALHALDEWVAQGKKPTRDILWAIMWYAPFRHVRILGRPEETFKKFNEFIANEQAFANIPRRERAGAILMLQSLEKLCPEEGKHYPPSVMKKSYFSGTLALLEIVSRVFAEEQRHLECWQNTVLKYKSATHAIEKIPDRKKRRRRGRRRPKISTEVSHAAGLESAALGGRETGAPQ